MEKSKYFDKVSKYFESGFWNENRVHLAVDRWITKEEFKKITGKEYKGAIT